MIVIHHVTLALVAPLVNVSPVIKDITLMEHHVQINALIRPNHGLIMLIMFARSVVQKTQSSLLIINPVSHRVHRAMPLNTIHIKENASKNAQMVLFLMVQPASLVILLVPHVLVVWPPNVLFALLITISISTLVIRHVQRSKDTLIILLKIVLIHVRSDN